MSMAFKAERAIAAEVAKAELSGVGEIPSLLEQLSVAIHYRRVLTDAEIERLTPEWCAIPAIDEAGHGKLLEINT
jgi:hypothetical protein